MKREAFFYHLPQELIAQRPTNPRDASRLLCLDRRTGETQHRIFRDITELLQPGDVLVVNDSKVIPARLVGKKEGTGANVELLLLKNMGEDHWECLAKPGKRLPVDTRIVFGNGRLTAKIVDIVADGNRIVQFFYQYENFFSILDQVGQMPLPHYITAPLQDNSEYQTVYAQIAGSAAAPTAGLHFTDELLQRIRDKGVFIEDVTLHVGLGTFRPVKEDDITNHLMHSEYYSIPRRTADAIADAKRQGRRVIAVGTTSCRTLEAAAQQHGSVIACAESTDIFIYPGYEFRVIDGLITNFHLPESTLIMLVSAFAGYDNTMRAYREAVDKQYRFFSFGDAMFIA